MATTKLKKLSNTMARLIAQGVLTQPQYDTYHKLVDLHDYSRFVVDNWATNNLANAVCDLSNALEDLE